MDEGVQTADAIVNNFPHPVLTRINGPPSRADIDENQEKQTENAASRPSTRGGGTTMAALPCCPPPLVDGRDAAFSFCFSWFSSISALLGGPFVLVRTGWGKEFAIASAV